MSNLPPALCLSVCNDPDPRGSVDFRELCTTRALYILLMRLFVCCALLCSARFCPEPQVPCLREQHQVHHQQGSQVHLRVHQLSKLAPPMSFGACICCIGMHHVGCIACLWLCGTFAVFPAKAWGCAPGECAFTNSDRHCALGRRLWGCGA